MTTTSSPSAKLFHVISWTPGDGILHASPDMTREEADQLVKELREANTWQIRFDVEEST